VSEAISDPSIPKAKPRAAGFAMLVAAGILLSRIAGLVRQKVFAHFLGNSPAAGVFSAAIRIPNFLQNLFGEGVLSASFIPVYARLIAEGEEELAGRVAGAVAALLAVVISILVVIGVVLTPWILIFIAPGFHGAVRELTITVVRIMFPGVGLLVMSAWCLGILNSHRKFFLSYVAPVFMNIVMIAALVIFGTRLTQSGLAVAAAWGTVAGAFVQFGVQVPFVFQSDRNLRFVISTTLDPVREILRNFTPVLIGRGVVQLSAYLDNLLATLLGTAAASGLAYAQMIYLLPISLFGMSVAAAELPQMSTATGDVDAINTALRKRLERGLRQIAFFVVPSVMAFVAIGNMIVSALYQGGAFTSNDTLFVWYILIGSTVGLLAATLGRLYSSAFYALRDTKTPLRYAMLRVTLTGVLGYLAAIPLRPLIVGLLEAAHVPIPLIGGNTVALGSIGLTASAGVAGWVEFLLLRRALQQRVGKVQIAASFLVQLWTAAAAAAVAGVAFERWILPHFTSHLPHVLRNIGGGLLVCAVFGVIYFAAVIVLRVPEAKSALARLRR
jgi:putative peptidoglycan lipid II flippase